MPELVLRLAVQRLQKLVLAEETARLNRSAREDLNVLLKELKHMQLSLRMRIQSQDIELQIEEFNYQIEDVIESYRVLARSSKTWGVERIKMFLWLKFRLSSTLHSINRKMEQINKPSTESPVQQQIDKQVEPDNPSTESPVRQKINNNNTLIGLEQLKNQVCQILLHDEGSSLSSSSSSSSHIGVPVISIYGVAGSGKTALAELVSNQPKIVEKFKIRKQIIVSNELDIRSIYEQLFEPVDKPKMSYIPDEQLPEKIEEILNSKRSLIVLDDIRSTEAWKTVCGMFPKLHKDSYVLATTRVRHVAEYISQDHSVRTLTLLNEDDSRDLYTKVFEAPSVLHASGSNSEENEQELIMKMVRCCAGSARLITELALHLQSKRRELKNENIGECLSEFCCQVYNKLTAHLRPCILYLGHFLEEQEIDPEKLSHLWMIEGLLSTGESVRGERMMDMTARYLKELALERMVEVQQAEEVVPATTEKFKACGFVQCMEDFCVPNSEQKRFLKIIDLRQKECSLSSSDGPRRFVIYLGKNKVDISPEVAKRIRSLRVVLLRNVKQKIPKNELVCPTKMLNLNKFEVLRILDFDGIDFQRQKLPRGIFNLKLLTYLSFKGCVLEELPSSISKLSYLQVLDLRVEEGLVEIKIPNVLGKMRRLSHLYLPLKFATRNGEELRLDSLTELETLVNFNTRLHRDDDVSEFPSLCRANDVLKLCKLRHLAAKVEKNFDDFESITNYMKTTTSNSWLLHCSIDIISLDCYAAERDSVLREFLRCKVLGTLHFKGGIGRLPPYGEISQNLTHLVFNKSNLKEDPMPTLEKLPNLGILIFANDAYVGKKMVCSASGFPQLKYLLLLKLSFLQKVEVENTAMPILPCILIRECKKLDTNNCEKLRVLLGEEHPVDTLLLAAWT